MRRSICFIIFLLALLLFPTVNATVYYVDGGVSSSGSGTSWSQAKRTIAEGVALLNSGDTLKIATGTYNEPMVVDGRTFISQTRIETDDKSGNPGVVVLTGRTNADGYYRVVYIHNAGKLTLDGRQSTMEGDAQNGFILSPSSSAAGVCVNEYSSRGGSIKILRVEITGTKPGGDIGTIEVYYPENLEIAYCTAHQTGGNNGDVIMVIGEYGSPAPLSGSIHHNDVSGNPSDGYGAITQKRTNGVDVYNNYIHNIGNRGVGIILRDFQFVGQNSGDVYNNVIVNDGSMRTGIQIRGMTAGQGGGTDNSQVYGNTIHNINGFLDAVFMVNDGSDNNKIFNNLIIGNGGIFVTNWGDNEGSGNQLYNNVVTGSVSTWFDSSGLQGMFSTTSPNEQNAGTGFIRLSGSVPAEYYDLTSSKNGVGTIPNLDYNGDSRSSPPDVGAFEFGGDGPQTCSQLGGTCCQAGETCTGTTQSASDCSTCCINGTCQTAQQTCSQLGGVDCCIGSETCPGTNLGIASDCSGICCSEACVSSTPGGKEYWSTDTPVDLTGSVLEEKIVYVQITDDPSKAKTAYLLLQLYDADSIGEGHIYINGNGPIDLPIIPNPGSPCNLENCWFNDTEINPAWLIQGNNEFRFTHEDTWGYSVLDLGIMLEGQTYHRADTNQDGCIEMSELMAFIELWKIDSQEVPMPELMEAIGMWKAGTGC